MRKACIFASTLALFNWSITNAYAFPSPSPPSATAAVVDRHQSFLRDSRLVSREIRNADYSTSNSSPPGLNTKFEPDTSSNPQAHPSSSQGNPSAPQIAESKDGKTKAARSVRVERRHDPTVVEGTTIVPGGVRKRDSGIQWRRRLAPGEPVGMPPDDLDPGKSYVTRAPKKIDGFWWKKRQEIIRNINHSPSPSDDVARAPKDSRAERENLKWSDSGALPKEPVTPLSTPPKMARKPGVIQHGKGGEQWSERNANIMKAWDKLARPRTN